MKQEYDILIVGAGIVGCSLAIALSHLPLRIALMEQITLKRAAIPSLVDKPIALNYASIRIFQSLGLWTALAAYACPIEKVVISQQGYFSRLSIQAKEIGASFLGYVLPENRLNRVLTKRLRHISKNKTSKKAGLDLFFPAQCQELTKIQRGWKLIFRESEKTRFAVCSRFVIAADGSASRVRDLLNINLKIYGKTQDALVTTLDISLAHHNVAYQRFTEKGIIACLPLVTNQIGLVWTGDPSIIQHLASLPKADFFEVLQQHFAYRFGKLAEQKERRLYSLKRSFIAQPQAQPGLVLLGNAAHTFSPIAAQGLNLALHDMTDLIDRMEELVKTKKDLSDPNLSESYLRARLPIHKRAMRFTELLSKHLSPQYKKFAGLCNNNLWAMDLFPPLKINLSRRLMGIHGRLPHLIRGSTLRQEEM